MYNSNTDNFLSFPYFSNVYLQSHMTYFIVALCKLDATLEMLTDLINLKERKRMCSIFMMNYLFAG